MVQITFISKEGTEYPTEGQSGSIMELAVANNVPGIDGDCGGVCSCATCHVHVRPEDFQKTGPASDLEKDLLEFDENVSPFSRLSCQIQITEQLNHLTLEIPN